MGEPLLCNFLKLLQTPTSTCQRSQCAVNAAYELSTAGVRMVAGVCMQMYAWQRNHLSLARLHVHTPTRTHTHIHSPSTVLINCACNESQETSKRKNPKSLQAQSAIVFLKARRDKGQVKIDICWLLPKAKAQGKHTWTPSKSYGVSYHTRQAAVGVMQG
eukprot:scaffold165344_cov18-Tisochrysis_lutea.AAC.1